MLENYLNILEDSLKKKVDVLERIKEVNQVQAEMLKIESFDLEAFDRCVDEKDLYLEELNKLDEGFEALYEKIRQELLQNKAKYPEQIRRIQKLIGDITDRSISIQAQESRNKAQIEKYFSRQREELGKVRRSSKVAFGYYQNMGRPDSADGQYMDTKK